MSPARYGSGALGLDPDHAKSLLLPVESVTVDTKPIYAPLWCTPTTLRPDAVLDPEGAQTLLWRVAGLTGPLLK